MVIVHTPGVNHSNIAVDFQRQHEAESPILELLIGLKGKWNAHESETCEI
jgi:hypothetical protein